MSNQSAPLALRADAPAVFGSRDEVKAIADRISVMLPSAHLSDWQLKQANRAELQKVLDESVYRAAQLCVFYRLVPGEDVHVIPFGNNWAVDMGIETWKKSADRYCSLHGITYHIHTEEMSVNELKERRGENYQPEDYGMVAYLWRSDKKDVYDIFGAKQSMSRAAGIWAKKARYNKSKNEWQEDNIPTQRSKQDVAKRRAMKAVLKLEFSLDSLLAATPAEIRQNVQYLESDLRHEEMRRAVPNDRRPEIDEDGFIVIEATTPRGAAQDMEFVVVNAPDVDDIDEGPDFDDAREEEEPEMEEPSVDYRAIATALTGNEKTLVDWAKKYRDEGGPATKAQYNFLSGEIDKLTTKKGHNLLLGVLIGREVTGANPPSFKVCKLLLDFILKEMTAKDDNGKPLTDADGVIVKVANPYFRQDVVDSIKAMWQTISADPTTAAPQPSEV